MKGAYKCDLKQKSESTVATEQAPCSIPDVNVESEQKLNSEIPQEKQSARAEMFFKKFS